MSRKIDKSLLPVKKLISSIILFVCFILFTVAVLLFDVQAIGPQESKVGFASLNGSFRDAIGTSNAWYEISEYLGYAIIGIALGFAAFGVLQLIKRKSFKKVDGEIWLLAALYIDLGISYVLFEVLKVNYRPVLDEGELAASYPSSHCLLAIVICGSAIAMIRRYINRHTLCNISVIVVSLMLSFTLAGRVIAGVHWLTDIIGGLLLGSALLSLFFAGLDLLDAVKAKAGKNE